ncbi:MULTISPECIES: DUF5672 family protein [unclassified Novosphingobium]|uniref:DUF5672 family protein n=1 Tax=unclassified Novosphingobium TaxID=2644732 RepID=UPI00149407D1|nr:MULTISPECIES: DUF5672 family protein [unclassified Novosphingobium]MBB3651049.1 hypothetical protein [Novosphingobium sp. BK626]MBB3356485.1 hypothetical protein [Novosphingobium sp. BK256]MBB3377254.1 hypothetical protein [Novosphingobium sp. BK258]MBB3419335.1 hypothetical protein [Novosphingobium sp. BK267]MBB3499816.1 hypothetical protein [Novosphingobium sp. BK336]
MDKGSDLRVRPLSELVRLPEVTLCAVTSVNVVATVRAMQACLVQIDFADCVLFTDADIAPECPMIRVERIAPLRSSAAYSHFVLQCLPDYVSTSHALVVQWDGHVLDGARWNPDFLQYDYIGASWPQFDDGHDVGNGGFSLRSRRLMALCRDPAFRSVHPEDIAIGRVNRAWLENQGMQFAPRHIADCFAAERSGDPLATFGYHGVFNMPRALGLEDFWTRYRQLDERGTIRPDFWPLLRAVAGGRRGALRVLRMIADRVLDKCRG